MKQKLLTVLLIAGQSSQLLSNGAEETDALI